MSVQNYAHTSDKRLITGTSGSGKTTLFEKLITKEKARVKFIYDHQGEYAHRFKVKAVSDPEALANAASAGGLICFDPLPMFPGQSAEGFEAFCQFVFQACEVIRGRKIFCCDELQKLTSNRDEPADLLAILDTGRRYQLDCFFISQAPNRIHNGIRNQLTQIYTFRQSDQNAIAYLKDNGFDENEIRNLAKFKYLWRNLDTGETATGG
jgi:hypothetical protein